MLCVRAARRWKWRRGGSAGGVLRAGGTRGHARVPAAQRPNSDGDDDGSSSSGAGADWGRRLAAPCVLRPAAWSTAWASTAWACTARHDTARPPLDVHVPCGQVLSVKWVPRYKYLGAHLQLDLDATATLDKRMALLDHSITA